MAADWTGIENAIVAWIRAATGLPTGQIVLHEQSAHRPHGAFVSVRLNDLTPIGTYDELIESYDATRSAGQEIQLTVRGTRELLVSIQVFGAPTVSPGTARAMASQIQTALGLPSIRAAFDAVDIAVFDRGAIQNLTGIAGTAFEGRATLEVRFGVTEDASEFIGYIAEVGIEDDLLAPPVVFKAPLP